MNKSLLDILALSGMLSTSGCNSLSYHPEHIKKENISPREGFESYYRIKFVADYNGRIKDSIKIQEMEGDISDKVRPWFDESPQDYKIRVIGKDGKLQGIYSTPKIDNVVMGTNIIDKNDNSYTFYVPNFEGKSITEISLNGISQIKIDLP